MREVAQSWKERETHQICHTFGVGDAASGELRGDRVVCRGWYDTQRIGELEGVDDETLRQIAERIGFVTFVPLPAKPIIDRIMEEEEE